MTSTSADTVQTLKRLPNNALVYRTTKTVENPVGDGRHNRADWRPEFDKNTVTAGTLFAVDSEGNLYELSRSVRVVPAAKAAVLRDRLLEVATQPLQSEIIEEVTTETVAESLGGANAVLAKLVDSLGITPDKLRALFADDPPAAPAPAHAGPKTTVRKNQTGVPAASDR